MATRKKKSEKEIITETSTLVAEVTLQETEEVWPKVTIGSHSVRTEYKDGRVDFVSDWEKLCKDVSEAIAEYEKQQSQEPKKTKKTKKAQ